jgi:hypothetical protein
LIEPVSHKVQVVIEQIGVDVQLASVVDRKVWPAFAAGAR